MKQLTSYLSLSRGYIFQKINEGTFPEGFFIPPGVRAWEKSEIDAWINKKLGENA
jgi:predicted DNA-binding transcriptional regulator AlpA